MISIRLQELKKQYLLELQWGESNINFWVNHPFKRYKCRAVYMLCICAAVSANVVCSRDSCVVFVYHCAVDG